MGQIMMGFDAVLKNLGLFPHQDTYKRTRMEEETISASHSVSLIFLLVLFLCMFCNVHDISHIHVHFICKQIKDACSHLLVANDQKTLQTVGFTGGGRTAFREKRKYGRGPAKGETSDPWPRDHKAIIRILVL